MGKSNGKVSVAKYLMPNMAAKMPDMSPKPDMITNAHMGKQMTPERKMAKEHYAKRHSGKL